MEPASAEWERRFCTNRSCTAHSWLVLPAAMHERLWWVAQYDTDEPYAVAAAVPICICCGQSLVTGVEIDGGIGAALECEDGAVFDFLRQL